MFLKMSFSTSNLRSQVLHMYRKTLRLAKTWQAKDPSHTEEERKYILNEAKTLFRRNKNVTSTDEIKLHLHEVEARIAIAEHYKNPYPRPVNLPQTILMSIAKKKKSRSQEEIKKFSKPVYLKSYEEK